MMKLKNLLFALSLIASTIGIGINSAQARQPTVEEARQMLNKYCTKEAQIAYNLTIILSGGNQEAVEAGLNSQQCFQLRGLYQQLLNQQRRRVKQRSNQRRRNYLQEYNRRFGTDGSFRDYTIESIRETNCLASSEGC